MELNKDGWGSNGNNGNNNNAKPNNGGVTGDFSSLISILTDQSLMANNNGIVEMKDIRKAIDETLKSQRSTAAKEAKRNTIPKMMDMTPEQSPHLPGIILYTVIGSQVYLMPTVFYKKDVATDALETINLGNNTAPQTYNKFAESFITDEMREKVMSAFSTVEGKNMSRSFIISNYVIDVDMYMCVVKDAENGISAVSNAVLNEWYAAINNFTLMAVANTDVTQMPNPWREGHLLGNDDTAVARIDTVQHPLVVDGHPAPYNLQIKLATAPKGNIYSQNYNTVRTVATTFLNVSLEVMDPMMYRRAIMNNPMGIGAGPLVPVISLGKTIPGEQMHNNNSILTTMLGLYVQLAANNQVFFSEALRQREIGARGSLANLADIAYRISGRAPANNEILTPKSVLDQRIVLKFIQNYVAQRAVFVMDIPRFSEKPSDAEILWNLLSGKNTNTDSTYYKAFLMMVDKLSNGQFIANIRNAKENNNEKIWKPGEPIMTQTPVIIPVGTAKGRNGYFSLEEVDQILLRDPLYYGGNEAAIAQYNALQNGSSGKDLRVRQYEMKKMLEGMFSGNVSLVGWKSRWKASDKFLNTFAQAMSGAGNITVTSNSATQVWESQVSNDYLMGASSAVINNNGGGAQGIGGIFNTWGI